MSTSPAEARRHTFRLTLVVLAMFGFGFALVPLYEALCEAVGINGKMKLEAVAAAPMAVDSSRQVTVQFVTTVNGSAPWSFGSEVREVRVHPGEFVTVNFSARNALGESAVAQAVPQVTPWSAARHLRKAECFCFNPQTFTAGEEKQMPVRFVLDPELPKDVELVTLSYTLYNITDLAQREPVKSRS